MVQSNAETVKEYLDELDDEKRSVISEVRKEILKNLPEGYKESMNWGMISYEVPLSTYPDTYNNKPLMFAGLAAQKNHYSLYLTPVYQSEALKRWLLKQFEKENKKIDMGKSCLRFKKIDDLPLKAVGELIKRISVQKFIDIYEESRK
ncbi:MAG: iron chaperone [Bacillota bacterium]